MKRVRLRTAAIVTATAVLVSLPGVGAQAARSERARHPATAPAAADLRTVPVTGFALATGDAGLVEATQGGQYGQNGIVVWNGAMWFAMEGAGKLGRIDTSGRITEYAVPAAVGSPGNGPRLLSAAGPDALWFAADGEPLDGRVARVNSSATVDVLHDVGGYLGMPSVAARADGGAWVLYGDGEGISVLAADGTEKYFEAPRYRDDVKSTVAPDGALWFNDGNAVVKRITDSGSLVNFPATGSGSVISSMTTAGGSVWYAKFNPGSFLADSYGGVIGRLSPDGVPTVFEPPVENLVPAGLTPASDGGVWFTTGHGSGLGHLSSTGAYALAKMPAGTSADSLVEGPDGNLWITDGDLNRIGLVTLADFAAATAPPAPQPPPVAPDAARPRLPSGKAVARKGRLAVKVSCTGTGTCAGPITVKVRKRVLARGRYSVAAGTTTTVKLTITKAGRKALRGRKVKARVVVGRGSSSTTRTVTVRIRR